MRGEFHLTPELMEGAYEFIRNSPPFCKWKELPEAEEVEFHVLATPQIHGDCWLDPAAHRISIRLSIALVGSTDNLLATMAHEMIHAYQMMKPAVKTGRAEHDSFFNKQADKTCKFHHFDRKLF